jgi:short-subunit dehydrogenase
MMKDFSTKKVVIIGATGGLGKAISISLAGRNANLYLIGRDENKLDEVKNEVKCYTGNIVISSTIKRDANFNDWEIIASTIQTELGIPDIIINAIGVDVRKSIQDQDDAEIISQLDTNLKTPIYITKAFLPYFLKQNKGEIVHFSGFLDGRLAFPYYSIDVASRAGLVSFIESINREINNKSICIASYCPQVADTDSERPFHPIWKEMGIPILTTEKIADDLIHTLGSSKTLRISGGFINSFFAKINSASPRLANLIIMNSYSEILRKNFGGTVISSNKNSILSKIGIFLIILSFILYGFIFLVPFLPISLEVKGVIITGLIASGEGTFWIGLIFAGKEVYQSMKNKIKYYYKNIFNSKNEQK